MPSRHSPFAPQFGEGSQVNPTILSLASHILGAGVKTNWLDGSLHREIRDLEGVPDTLVPAMSRIVNGMFWRWASDPSTLLREGKSRDINGIFWR